MGSIQLHACVGKKNRPFSIAILTLLVHVIVAEPKEVVVAGVTITTTSKDSMKKLHDDYELIHTKHVAALDVWESTEFVVRSAKIAKADLQTYASFSPYFHSFTSTMTHQQREDFALGLLGATFEMQGSQLAHQISLRSADLRVVALMVMVTKKDSNGNIDMVLSSLSETTRFQNAVSVWKPDWHAKIENQRMLEGWISYRLLTRLHQEPSKQEPSCARLA